jgi:hypothetical protein
MKINERIRAAKTLEQLQAVRHDGSTQWEASAKTLRKRARLVKQKEKELTA